MKERNRGIEREREETGNKKIVVIQQGFVLVCNIVL